MSVGHTQKQQQQQQKNAKKRKSSQKKHAHTEIHGRENTRRNIKKLEILHSVDTRKKNIILTILKHNIHQELCSYSSMRKQD